MKDSVAHTGLARDTGNLLDLALLLAVAFIWGSLFILVKKGLTLFSAYQLTSLRFFVCFVLLVPFLPAAIRAVNRKNLAAVLIVALVGSGLSVLLLTIGQQHVNSATTGVINALSPLFTLAIGALFFHIAVTWSKGFGVLLGLLGAVFLVFLRTDGGLDTNFGYGLLMIGAAVCYGISSNVLRSRLRDFGSTQLTALTFAIVGLPSALVFLGLDGGSRLENDPRFGIAIGVGLSIAAVLAVIGYYKLIQRRGALYASTVTYLMPLVSIFWGVLDGESIGAIHFLALGLILAGVSLANFSKR